MKELSRAALVSCGLVACAFPKVQTTEQTAQAPRLPVREVTVFKDGHAYVLREEPLAADAGGRVVLEKLPVPVLGTFFPYATGGARLVSAVSGRDHVSSAKEALDLQQLVLANVGKDATILTKSDATIMGRIVGVPKRPRTETSGEQQGSVVLIAVSEGTRAIPLDTIRELEIQGELATQYQLEEERERLTLRVEGGGRDAKVGVVYVQRGLRWIPAYKVDIDGKGKAAVSMEGTLVNDLIDLDDATVHLVIGAPKFEFKGLVDPISLQQELAQVTAQMQEGRYVNAMSNVLMTQAAVYDRGMVEQQPAEPEVPEVMGGAANEDLYVFTVEHITLKKGERMVLPIRQFELGYRDVYTLDVPFLPPMEMRDNMQQEQLELLGQLAAPKAQHVLRLKNAGDVPLTTAPALVLANGRLLAQGRVNYAPPGAETDLAINTAIEIHVDTSEEETGRVGDAMRWGGTTYGRIDLSGKIELTNRKGAPVEIEVKRRVLGLVDEVGQGGTKAQLDWVSTWGELRGRWWNWPYWWSHVNGFGEFRWKLTLPPGEPQVLDATWHYFWS